jgi:hypothetical protein
MNLVDDESFIAIKDGHTSSSLAPSLENNPLKAEFSKSALMNNDNSRSEDIDMI